MSVNAKDETIKKYLEGFYLGGEEWNKETLRRFKSEGRKRFPEWMAFMESTKAIRDNYSQSEIDQIAKGSRIIPTRTKTISMQGNHVRFAFITDTHMGGTCFHQDVWEAIVKEINTSNVDMIFHTGDVVDGTNSSRMDCIYDLTHIGYSAQKEYAIENLSMLEAPIYAVSGNHDRWYIKSAGARIVDDIANNVPNMTFLGDDMADFIIENGERPIRIRLWHGEDGSSYATSYRVQKLVESFSGGDKPSILLCGHTHKQIAMVERNIECISGGAVCFQSNWMRSKKMANHTGFYIVDFTFNERGIVKFSPTWYPFYS